MLRFCRSLAAVAVALAPLMLGAAVAQSQTAYPDRPVKIIVPIGPGGSYDLVGRHLADALSKRMGQAFFVENKPGAGTVVGTQAAAQSEPDGYTLMVGGLSNMAFNSALYSKLGYDPLRDFVPVALIYRFGYVMVGRKDMPQLRLQDIVAAAKADPGSITVATAGVGTGQQLVAAAFMKAAGVKLSGSALQGFAAGVHRSARRPHRSVLRLDCRRPAIRAIGTGEGHRRAVVEAQSACARCADHVGGGRARSRCRFLARNLCTRKNSAGSHRSAAPGYPRFVARLEGALREEWR